jgi:rod shape-determining protein MreC
MFTLHRWWNRYRFQTLLVGVALGSAVLIRQTNGALLFEVYHLVAGVFRPNPVQENLLSNAQLQELQLRLTELEQQNQRLRDLVGFQSQSKQEGLLASIIGRSADHWWQQVTLGRGSNDGVQIGSVVTAPGGLVGRITHVTPTTSRVLLLSDPTSRVGVLLSRSRSMGYIRGQASNRAVLEFFEKGPDVRKGDVVVSSALSQLFPAGLPVGRVESVNLNKSPAPEAIIELSAPISSLEWVVIQPPRLSVQPEENSDQPQDAGQKAEPQL